MALPTRDFAVVEVLSYPCIYTTGFLFQPQIFRIPFGSAQAEVGLDIDRHHHGYCSKLEMGQNENHLSKLLGCGVFG